VLDKKQGHNMLALMFGSWFKNMQLVISNLGRDFAIVIVTKYDEQ
jgi:hypothetical protein